MNLSPLIDELIDAFRCLPGVGPKSAQRMALQLLERNRVGGARLASALTAALDVVGNCAECRTLTEETVCRLCASDKVISRSAVSLNPLETYSQLSRRVVTTGATLF